MDINHLNKIKQDAKLLHSRETIDLALDKLVVSLYRDYHTRNPIFLVVMNGGLIFAGRLLPMLNFPAQIDYCHATRYRGETRGSDLEWKAKPQLELKGRHVVIIDDILDEGHTLQAIKQDCIEREAASVKTLVLIEKIHDRKAIAGMRADYCELETPDHYIFGYGMDYNHYWRNSDQIYLLNTDET